MVAGLKQASAAIEIKRVGRSGQISIGKQFEGKTFQERVLEDGSILLTPVVVVPQNSWLARDSALIAASLQWAAENPAQPTSKEELKGLLRKVSAKRGK